MPVPRSLPRAHRGVDGDEGRHRTLMNHFTYEPAKVQQIQYGNKVPKFTLRVVFEGDFPDYVAKFESSGIPDA
eukprot:4677953-Pleurochrysis_carterae.AAC.2